MSTRAAALTALAALALAGCSSSTPPQALSQGSDPADVLRSAASYQASLPACSEVFRPGVKVTAKGAGPTQIDCKDPDGTLQIIPLIRCNNGSHLGTVEAHTGAPAGWFFTGQPFHAIHDSIADDKGYGAAYHACYR